MTGNPSQHYVLPIFLPVRQGDNINKMHSSVLPQGAAEAQAWKFHGVKEYLTKSSINSCLYKSVRDPCATSVFIFGVQVDGSWGHRSVHDSKHGSEA